MFYNAQYNVYVTEGTQFTLGDVTYPPQWLNQSTPEQKAAIGLVEVVATNSPADQTYYWVSETINGAELTYTNTPKDLDTVKENAISQVNNTAYSLLFPSDWMVVKAVETQGTVPTDWNTYRADVRFTANTTKDALAVATTVDEVANIMSSINWPHDPNYVPVEEHAA